jgi:DNA-binding NarL/FixJ family response regulator
MIRVLVVDDHPAVQAGLDALLRREPGLVPVALARDPAGAIHALSRERIDVALVDYNLGEENGVTLTQAIRASEEAPAVVLYAALVDTYLEVAGRLAGAAAVVTKGARATELFDVIRRVARGEAVRPAEPARLLATAGAAFAVEDRPIVALLLDGTSRADAAAALGLEPAELEGRTAAMLGRLPGRRQRESVIAVPEPGEVALER